MLCATRFGAPPDARTCRDGSMDGGEAGSTSQHFFHPAVEPVSPSYLPGWPGQPYALPTSASAAIRAVMPASGRATSSSADNLAATPLGSRKCIYPPGPMAYARLPSPRCRAERACGDHGPRPARHLHRVPCSRRLGRPPGRAYPQERWRVELEELAHDVDRITFEQSWRPRSICCPARASQL